MYYLLSTLRLVLFVINMTLCDVLFIINITYCIVLSLYKIYSFDTLDHTTLLQRLNTSYGLQGSTRQHWFSSYLDGRTQSVRCGPASSTSAWSCAVRRPSEFGSWTDHLSSLYRWSFVTDPVSWSASAYVCRRHTDLWFLSAWRHNLTTESHVIVCLVFCIMDAV